MLPLAVWSQDVQIVARVSRNAMTTDDNLQLNFTYNADGKFTAPDLSGFKILSGPNRGSSSNVSIINGVYSSSVNYTVTYLLRPVKEGEITIGPATLEVNGKKYKTNSIKITVGKGAAVSSDGLSNKKPVFTVISLSKNKVYKGEHLVATYKLYSRYNRILDYDLDIPIQNGFWAQEIDPGKKGWGSFVENVNGIDYAVAVLKKEILYPNAYGKFTLKPFDLMAVLQINFWESERFDMVSNAPVIEVLPLPANAPAGFNGAVGKFEMESSISKTELKANDGVDVAIKIKGNGNFKLIDKINYTTPNGIDAYDPEIKDKISVTEGGTSGSKEYKYLFIPRKGGEYKLGPIPFTYFDPETKSYHTLSTPEWVLKVEKGENESSAEITSSDPDMEVVDNDVRYLHTFSNDIRTKNDHFFGSPLFVAGITLSPLAFIVLLFIRKKKEKSAEELAQERMKKANRFAVSKLHFAKTKLDAGDLQGFYAETLKALDGYVSDKLKMPVSEMTKDNIAAAMHSKNISGPEIKAFLSLLESCEMARYGMQQSGMEKDIYNRSIALINNIESGIK